MNQFSYMYNGLHIRYDTLSSLLGEFRGGGDVAGVSAGVIVSAGLLTDAGINRCQRCFERGLVDVSGGFGA